MPEHGAPKYLTESCPGCPYLLVDPRAAPPRGDRVETARWADKYRATALAAWRFCIWSRAIKTLVDRGRPRQCGLRHRPSRAAGGWIHAMESPVAAPGEEAQRAFSFKG